YAYLEAVSLVLAIKINIGQHRLNHGLEEGMAGHRDNVPLLEFATGNHFQLVLRSEPLPCFPRPVITPASQQILITRLQHFVDRLCERAFYIEVDPAMLVQQQIPEEVGSGR